MTTVTSAAGLSSSALDQALHILDHEFDSPTDSSSSNEGLQNDRHIFNKEDNAIDKDTVTHRDNSYREEKHSLPQ